MEKEPFKSQLQLVVQASIPVRDAEEGDAEYGNLKIFLLAISPDITLNGQTVKMLEPYCKKPRTEASPGTGKNPVRNPISNGEKTKEDRN